jgi:hypothetical protein
VCQGLGTREGSGLGIESFELIQVDINGHPPFPAGSKQLSGDFGNLLFLAGFNFWGHFEGLNEGFIVDSGSQKNLISIEVVKHLRLLTTPHPHPYNIGWLQ